MAESPDGLGVGQAALSVSDRYRLPAGEVPRLAGREVLVLAAFLDVTARNRRTYAPRAVTPARRELARRLIAALNDHWERPAWREVLDAEIEGLAVLPAEVRDAAAAALTSGYQAADRAYQELMLDAVAATMDDATLEAAVRFETSDGAPFRRALAEASDDIDVLRRAAIRRIAETARADFCRSFDCGLAGSQPSAASSAPSTRTP
ncbi:hypothetical protein [Phenylobacterium sp. J367]|uniref:hypothetical protein n=1 Tax=Phenylobacterium sp. J367 TaxID=2898435 RepID=UPI002151C18D|nr:hypothetical protein [Phenylobacterium sp. J367]MCR5878291.1 hypothetical protein [Phenylobacterium sp. J367]